MNKKILIGSAIAVAILVLVSFTGVVGYQITKSSTIAKASPLFSVRSSRAIDEDSKDIACDYVGKDIVTSIIIPNRNPDLASTQRIIKYIRNLDDKEYLIFINSLIKRLENRGITEISRVEILNILNTIRNGKEIGNKILLPNEIKGLTSDFPYLLCHIFDTIFDIILIIAIITMGIVFVIFSVLYLGNCDIPTP